MPDYRILVKQDNIPVVVTGATFYTFIESGSTQISQVQTGNLVDVTIYLPSGVTASEFQTYTGETAITLSGLRTDIDTVSGDTDTNTSNIATNTSDISYLSGQTDTKLATSLFATYTGTTAPAAFLPITGLTGYWTSGQTVDYVTGITPTLTWGAITGTLGNQTDLQNALDAKLPASDFNTFTGTTLPANYYNETEVDGLISGFTTATNFIQSGATVISTSGNNVTIYSAPTGVVWGGVGGTLSNQTDLQNALNAKLNESVYQSDMLIIGGEIDANATGIIYLSGVTSGKTSPANFIQSGITQISTSGNDVTIYVPADSITGVTFAMITGAVSGNTNLQNALNEKVDESVYQSDLTITGGEIDALQTGQTANTASIALKLATADFDIYSASTYNSITANTANIAANATGITANYALITGNTASIATKASQADFTGHTGNSLIHYEQSGITITESQVTNLVTDLAGKTATGTTLALNNAFTGHTGDTAIHYVQSAITLTQSQTTDLVTDLAYLQEEIDNLAALQTTNRLYVFEHTDSDIGGYETLSAEAHNYSATTETIALTAGAGEALIDAYATDVDGLGVVSIASGSWSTNYHAYVSSLVVEDRHI